LYTALAAVSAIALSSTAANAAVTIITPGATGSTTFSVAGNPFTGTDPVTATIGHTGIPTGSFEDIYQFTIGVDGQGEIGTGSGGITTNITIGGIGGLTDIDFLSVLVNGMAATGHYTDIDGNACTTPGVGTCGAGETFTIAGVPIFGGQLNTIDIIGTVGGPRGIGSYGGSATFLPTAPVPEPATWAMMLLGFLGVGSVMSRRKKTSSGLLQLA
jgi:hypothetical protein